MENLISNGCKLISYPLKEYWIDVGTLDNFKKAKSDMKNLNL